MKLNLFIDKTKIFHPKDAVFFEDDNEYFDIILKVYESLKLNSDLTIIFRLQSLKELIKTAFSSYKKIEIIEYKEITYRTLLKEKWNISVYDFEPSDKEILDQKLLESNFGTDKAESFSTILLSNCISPYLAEDYIPEKKFGSLINDLNKYINTARSLPSIVAKALNYKHSTLSKRNAYSDDFLNLIFHSPYELYENACLFSLIKDYPTSFKTKVQDQNWGKYFGSFSLKDIDISYFLSNSELFQHLKAELSIYFSSIKADLSVNLFENLVDTVSGQLVEEFDFIIEILSEKNEFVNKSFLKRLANKFSALDPALLGQLFNIEDKIKPEFELVPFNNLDTIDMVMYNAVNFYYPYKIWSDNTGHYDSNIMEWGFKFSEYMLHEYEKAGYHYEYFIHRFIHNNIPLIKESDLSIILIVDNLNYKYFRYLKEEFADLKIFLPAEPVPYLSLLPTTTSVGKYSILSGKRDKIDSSITNYKSLITSTWSDYFPEYLLTYFHSDLANLVKHTVQGKEIVFVNFLGIDEELHSSPKKTLIDHKESVKIILKKLTSVLNQFIKRNRKEESVKIFFISDHGSTQISEEYKNPINEISISSLLPGAEISSDHRFIKIQKNDLVKLQTNINIANELYCIDDKLSGDGNNYVIAKGYGTFKKSLSDAYVHGGATPEEMIVPGGYFTYKKTSYKDLIIQLTRTEYRYLAMETFILRLANPNEKRIDKIQIEIFENDIPKVKMYENDDIEPKSEILVESKFKINKKDKTLIRINVSYFIGSENINIEKEIPVKVKSMVETSLDMDNLLNL